MGLLQPTSGGIFIDGTKIEESTRRSWRKNVSHVSQSIYLTDASFRENIAFAVPSNEVDDQRVQRAAQIAQIAEYIEELQMVMKQ